MNIKNGTLELYSFNNGLGNPFIFNFSYYLISPVNFIGLLFNNGDLMYLAVILVKLAISAITPIEGISTISGVSSKESFCVTTKWFKYNINYCSSIIRFL